MRAWVNQADIDEGIEPGTTTLGNDRIKDLEQQNKELRRANGILRSASAFFRGGTRPPTQVMVDYIDQHRDVYPVEPICSIVPIAASTYWSTKTRGPSQRSQRDKAMLSIVLALHADNYSVYGAHKLWKAARREGRNIGRDQVARLMKTLDIKGVTRRRKRVWTTIQDKTA